MLPDAGQADDGMASHSTWTLLVSNFGEEFVYNSSSQVNVEEWNELLLLSIFRKNLVHLGSQHVTEFLALHILELPPQQILN